MTVFDIVNSFGLTIRTGKNRLDEEVTGGMPAIFSAM